MSKLDLYKYYAFISYNSKDAVWGKRLQRKLEHYRMPATLCSEHQWKRKPIRPVFYAPTDIQPGDLRSELKDRLKASRNLIVICSPHSAQSQWVGWEIEYFASLGRTRNIFFFIVDGEPHSNDPKKECFNPIIEQLKLPEILGANIHEKVSIWPWINRERAYVQLITKLLGVEFDTLWQRHKRLLVEKITVSAIGLFCVLSTIWCVWQSGKPVDVQVSVVETSLHNEHLPNLQKAVVSLYLPNECKSDTLWSIGSSISFNNIPHKMLEQLVHITLEDVDGNYCAIDTSLLLNSNVILPIKRDESRFGHIRFRLWKDPIFASGVMVSIAGYHTTSDDNGVVDLFIPLDKQLSEYEVTASLPLENNLLRMPLTESRILVVKSNKYR